MDKQNFNAISKNVQPYNNFIVDVINDHCLRMAIMEGEYRWHYHKHTDELFMVLEGELKIEIKERDAVFLKRGEFIKIPAGIIHKTSAATRTVNLTLEKNADDTVFTD
jgi:mannose-6-phosphate isomerase-like protein (cupin superfamily)